MLILITNYYEIQKMEHLEIDTFYRVLQYAIMCSYPPLTMQQQLLLQLLLAPMLIITECSGYSKWSSERAGEGTWLDVSFSINRKLTDEQYRKTKELLDKIKHKKSGG